MTEDNTTPRDTRDKFRRIYNGLVENPSLMKRDLYAEFMRRHFPEHADKKDQTYAREWAQRFRDDKHMHRMDRESARAYLKTLTTPIDGSAPVFSVEELEDIVEQVKAE